MLQMYSDISESTSLLFNGSNVVLYIRQDQQKRLCQVVDLQSMYTFQIFVFCNSFAYKKSVNLCNRNNFKEQLHFY